MILRNCSRSFSVYLFFLLYVLSVSPPLVVSLYPPQSLPSCILSQSVSISFHLFLSICSFWVIFSLILTAFKRCATCTRICTSFRNMYGLPTSFHIRAELVSYYKICGYFSCLIQSCAPLCVQPCSTLRHFSTSTLNEFFTVISHLR